MAENWRWLKMFKSDESFTCPSFETTFKSKLIRTTSINFRTRHLLIAFSEQVALLLRRSIEWYQMVDGNKENVTMLCKILRWNNVELNNVQNDVIDSTWKETFEQTYVILFFRPFCLQGIFFTKYASKWERKIYCHEFKLWLKTLIWKFHVVIRQTASKNCTKVRAARYFPHSSNHITIVWSCRCHFLNRLLYVIAPIFP